MAYRDPQQSTRHSIAPNANLAYDQRLWIWGVLAVAVALRVSTFRLYGIYHPDELYQYLEQAHRLVTGQGIIPWEYRHGMRSWLPPLLLSLPMRLGDLIAPGSLLPLILTKGTVAAISLAPIIAAYSLGARVSPFHGLVAAATFAVWFENVQFSGHVVMEILAVACFLPAAALIGPGSSRLQIMASGALLALASLLRFHYAPAFALFVLVELGARRSSWQPLLTGASLVLAFSAIVDLAMGQLPFEWIVTNVRENLVYGKSARFGVSEPIWYLETLFLRWGIAVPAILLLPLLVVRRYFALYLVAISNLIIHLTIGHKEYRFIWITTQILVLLSAIASAELVVRRLDEWKIDARGRCLALVMLIAAWAVFSATLSRTDKIWTNWNRYGARMEAMADAGQITNLCGIAVHYQLDYWSASYVYLRRDVPIYHPWRSMPAESAAALASNAVAYNVIMAPLTMASDIPSAYRPISCSEGRKETICLYWRTGRCTQTSASGELLQSSIVRRGY